MEPASKFVDANGLRFHYLEWGDPSNPPALLLHGMMAYAAVWNPLSRVLAPDFHVIALDQRGHGDSGHSETHEYSPTAMVKDIEEVIDALRLDNITLIGFSMGGRNAFMYAARHPEKVKRLIIMDMGPAMGRRIPIPGPDEEVQLSQPEVFNSVEEGIDFLANQNPRAKRSLFEEIVPPGLKQLPDGRWTWKWDPWISDRRRLFGMSEEALWNDFKSVKCPVLLLRGEESPVLDADVAQRMVQERPGTKFFTVPGSGHTILDDNPEFTIARVQEFIRETA